MQKLERKETYIPDTIFNLMLDNKEEFILDGDSIKLSSMRYRTFLNKGIKCVVCGIEGKYFAKERHYKVNKVKKNKKIISKKRVTNDKAPYHLNLYAIDDKGEEVLMTKDHIIPKSKGGSEKLDNMQTMCTFCNCEKDNK